MLYVGDGGYWDLGQYWMGGLITHPDWVVTSLIDKQLDVHKDGLMGHTGVLCDPAIYLSAWLKGPRFTNIFSKRSRPCSSVSHYCWQGKF